MPTPEETEAENTRLRAEVAAHAGALKFAHDDAVRACIAVIDELLNQAQAEARASHTALRDGAVQGLGRARDRIRRQELEVAVGPLPADDEAGDAAPAEG